MSAVKIRPAVLNLELAKRGWHASDLAHASRLSPATVSAAVRGRSTPNRTLRRIAEALSRQPVVIEIAALLGSDLEQRTA